MKNFLFLLAFLLVIPFFAFNQPSNDTSSLLSASEYTTEPTDGQLITDSSVSAKTTSDQQPATKPFVQKGSLGFSLIGLLRGLFGIFSLILLAWLFSSNRRAVAWKVVFTGLIIQVGLAFGVLFIPFVEHTFEFIGKIFVVILDFTKTGSTFLFNDLMNVQSFGFIFALQILPTIIFFSALTSVLFYLGVIQKVVWALAWLMTKALKISGAESLSVAGNIFLGQTESPLMIKAYLPKMNDSEMLLVMIGGMATVAGGVMAAYISFLGGDDPVQRLLFAKHLLTASVMAAPGAVVMSKILIPQTEEIDMKVEVSQEKIGKNFLDALSNGTTEGLKLAANVGAMLLVFFAFIAMINFILMKLGGWTSMNELVSSWTSGQYSSISLEFILGYTFAPLMWAIGVNVQDITLVGQLLGEKLIASEFVGYTSLAGMKEAGIFAHQKSVIMATYMLCGFANFASIGIQIGGIGGLAPNKRWFLSKYGMKALIGGTLASLLSATIIGTILG
ncbi:MAG: Na+ dependent nucleoside transporter [Bacteroidales bacterium]|nr:Na+ dependent nucleoside transporter [Bacteroidales bacterium]